MSNKSEIRKLVEAFELVLNEEDEAADELMHQYFVSLARRINEELEDEEISEDSLDYDMEDDLTSEIESDMDEIESEEGVSEDDDEMGYGDDEGEMEFDMDMGDMEGEGDEMSDLGDLIVSVEDAFEELKRSFERIQGEELNGDDEYGDDMGDMDMGDYGDNNDMGTDDMDDMDVDYGEEETEESMFEDDDEELDEDDEELDEGKDDEDLDEEKDEDLDEEKDDELDESVELSKVTVPANKEGVEAGAGGSFTTNTRSVENRKGSGPLKGTDANANMSTGGVHSGYAKQTAPKYPGAGGSPKDMGAPDNMVKGKTKSSQKKTSGFPENNKGQKEVGTGKGGKGAATNDKALIGKKVR